MSNKYLGFVFALLGLSVAPFAQAATDWSADEYDLYSGDFNGDGYEDLLYVAKDPAKASGIALSDGTAPNIPWQTWPSNYLNIAWSGNQYKIFVGDFNEDGKDDLFMQRSTPGNHYVIHMDQNGKVASAIQEIGNEAFGSNLALSADKHALVVGDFDGDGKADLFMQAVSSSGLNAILPANGDGQFSVYGETWVEGEFGLNWSAQKANVFAGDFDEDGRDDLLVQAKPNFVMIDYEVPFPVPVYPANKNGIMYSQGGATPFQLSAMQAWSRNANGVDWSPLTNFLIVGDFNGDGLDDVLFQPKYSGSANLLYRTSDTAFASGPQSISSGASLSGGSSRLVAANFDGGGAVGLYIQTLTAGGTNYIANSVGASAPASPHSPASATGVVPATAVGHTVGSFAVSNGGAATYTIPITVPPGVSGIQPSLAITYSSSAGNGLLGMGWNLSGLSQIDRCKKTLDQDGENTAPTLSWSDSLCLDGNKLRSTGGSTYQTEIETFSRITAYSSAGNGPAYFVVESKDGLKQEYGSTGDSRIEATAPGNTSTARSWMLNKVSDRSGNTMTISYFEDGAPSGSFRPNEINYTSNSNAGLTALYRVKFIWETRPAADTITSYFAGGLTTETNRLSRVETWYYDSAISNYRLVRKYQLSYNISGNSQRSRLMAVQECDGSGACLAPTTIGWQDGASGLSDYIFAGNFGSAAATTLLPGDINGDGRSDLIYPCGDNWCYAVSGSSGYAAFDTEIGHGNNYSKALPIDYNTDGLTDLIVPNASNTWQLLESTATGFTPSDTGVPASGAGGNAFVLDVNGDGRQDVIYLNIDGNGSPEVRAYLNTASGLSGSSVLLSTLPGIGYTNSSFTQDAILRAIQFADFNSDGVSDIVVGTYDQRSEWDVNWEYRNYYTTWYQTVLLSNGTGGFTVGLQESYGEFNTGTDPTVFTLDAMKWRVLDVNGDGTVDILYGEQNYVGGPFTWKVRYGTGSQFASAIDTQLPYAVKTTIVDWDSDGKSDLLQADMGTSNWKLLRATGDISNPFAAPVDTGMAAGSMLQYMGVDVNGDAQSDFLYLGSSYQLGYRLHAGVTSDVVKTVADGFGNSVDVTYASLTDSTVYTKGLPLGAEGVVASYPTMDVQFAMPVVKQYKATDGVGDTYTVSQKYRGLRVNLKGRGLEGFYSRTETDGRSGIYSTTIFNQSFPFSGTVNTVTVKQPAPNDKTISYTGNWYTEVTTISGYPARRYPYQRKTEQISYEVSSVGAPLDGAIIKRVTTELTDMDAYGNPGTVTATTKDETGSGQTFTSVTTNTFNNDTTNWCLGLVTNKQVTSTVPSPKPLAGGAAPTRTLKFDPDTDATKCRIYKQTIEPNTASQVVTEFEFDAFGHTKKTTMSASGISNRVAEVSYGTKGVFPVQFTNAVGEVSYKSYDYALGVPKTATDPNGLVATFDYDGFGRKTRANAPDGTATTWTMLACNVVNGYCGDGLLRYKVTQQQLDGSASHNVVRTDIQFFDAFNRALYAQAQTFSGAYSTVRSVYNNKGQLVNRSAPYFPGFAPVYSTNTYDLLGRVLKIERQASETDTSLQTVEYTYEKLVEKVKDPLNRTTTKISNAIGQVTHVTDANSSTTQYEYDALGNLAYTTDSAGNHVSNTFNVRGFKVASSDPDMGNWSYEYFPSGELKKQTDAKNQIVEFTYDNISRVKTRTEPEGVTTWNYGASAAARNIGQLDYVCMGTGASCAGQNYREAYTYDSLGRTQNIVYTQDTTYQVDYSYNNQGALDTLTYPTSTSGYRLKLQYAYANGQLSQIRDFNNSSTQFWTLNATNAADQAIDELMANGVRIINDYDEISGALSGRSSGSGGSTNNLQNLSYVWDKAGNLTKRYDNLQSGSCSGGLVASRLCEVFTYDNLNRLDASTRNGTQNLDVTVNAIGNLTLKSDFSASSYEYIGTQAGCTYNFSHTQPHAVRKIGSNVYCYDANGNMTKRAGSTIDWTSYNLPLLINSGSNSSQFTYGPARQRTKQIANYGGTTETTIYIGGLIEKVTRSGPTEYKHYIAGGSGTAIYIRRTDSTASTYYVSSDHLGSADVITDGSGAAVVRESFAAYGARRGSNWSGTPSAADQTQFTSTTRRGYTGHEMLDNLDLIHMNGRVYDPGIGRFISADPYIQSPLSQQSLNRYSYVDNGPMSATDPSGYLKLKDLLNPFSKDNPVGLHSNVGKIGPALALGFNFYGDYLVLQEHDKFFTRNPGLQFIPKVAAGVVAYYFPVLWWLPATVDAHFTRINGGDASDVLRSFAVGIGTSYFSGLAGNNVFAQAAVGCASAAASGGNCGAGAAAMGFSTAAGNLGLTNSFAGASLVGGIAAELGGGEFWEGARMAGLGYVSRNAVDVIEQSESGRTAGVPRPKLEAIANDPAVKLEIDAAWVASNPYDPTGATTVEHGFWIMKNFVTGSYSTKAFPFAGATRDRMLPGRQPGFLYTLSGRSTVAWFHTHPNPRPYIPGPSTADLNFSNQRNLPGIIRSHQGMHYFGP